MKTVIILSIFVICIYAIVNGCNSGGKASDESVPHQKTDTLDLALCGINGAYHIPFSVDLPRAQDIPGFPDTTALINFLQNRFDILSWKTFIALNWPATENGGPDSTACFTNYTGTTVWENWMPSTKIFIPPGQKPAPWQTGRYEPMNYYGL